MRLRLLRALGIVTAAAIVSGCAGSATHLFPSHSSAFGTESYDAYCSTQFAYVSNIGANTVEEFHQSGRAQRPIATISDGISHPGGLATDAKGNLYVDDTSQYNGHWVVQFYPPGATSPGKTYTKDLSTPSDTVVAKDGTIYTANFNNSAEGWVAVYPKGDVSKEYRLSDFGGGAPVFVTLDRQQNLYVAYEAGGGSGVKKYKPGVKTGRDLKLNFGDGGGIQVDSSGNIIVVQQSEPPAILIFPPGKTQPSRTITLPNGGEPFNIALNADDSALFASDSIGNVVDRFAYPSGVFQYFLAGGFSNPEGIATVPTAY